jgi:signal transduction histidine kinase
LVDAGISAISHDLRARFLSIQGFARILSESPLDSDGRALCERMEASATSGQALVRCAVEFLRIAEARITPARIDMERAVADAAARLDAGSGAQGPILGPNLTVEPLADAHADPVLIPVLLDHFFDNAARSAPGAPPDAPPDAPVRAAVSCKAGPDFNVYAIQDSGVVLAPDLAERAFELFSKVSDDEGSGLAIARLIAARHGGWAWCEPAPGSGTVFAFTLPACVADAAGGSAVR